MPVIYFQVYDSPCVAASGNRLDLGHDPQVIVELCLVVSAVEQLAELKGLHFH